MFCQGFARVFIRARWLCNREMLFFSSGLHTFSRVVSFSVRGQRAFSRGGPRSFRTRVRLLGWYRVRFVPACLFFGWAYEMLGTGVRFLGIFFGGPGPACIFFGWLCVRFGPGCVSSGGCDFAFGQHAFPRPRLLAAWPRLAFSQADLMLCRVISRFLRKAYSRFGPAGLTSAGHCFLPGASARFL